MANQLASQPVTDPVALLRRLTMAHMLWEDGFYWDGKEAAVALAEAIVNVRPEVVRDMAIEARTKMRLRHLPLYMARVMASLPTHRHLVAETLAQVIQRPDELAEYVALYWKQGRRPLSAQSKKGLAAAFTKFDEYQLAKYNRLDAPVKLRDVLFLCHARPRTYEQKLVWEHLINGTLTVPDTWEVAISATRGKNKKEEWTRLLTEQRLGGMALLRNLRNMSQEGVDAGLIRQSLAQARTGRILPFRYIPAAAAAPQFRPELEQMMFRSLAGVPQLPGRTVVVVDVSGSMFTSKITARSEMDRFDAAAALAILAREICQEIMTIGFSTSASIVEPRRGFALRDAIRAIPTAGNWTNLQAATELANHQAYDRCIVITDEQGQTPPLPPRPGTKAYMINVANDRNGIGENRGWRSITGWSEAVLDYIAVEEGLTDGSGGEEAEDL